MKAIVIACNTASALALDAVKDEFDLPIIGVVIPGARAAEKLQRMGKSVWLVLKQGSEWNVYESDSGNES